MARVNPPRQEPTIASILEGLGLPGGMGFVDLIRIMSRQPPGNPAIEFEQVSLTYGEAVSAVAGVAAHLERLGIKRGDHVAYLFNPHPHALFTLLAGTMIGAVMCPVNVQIGGEILARMLKRYDVSWAIVDHCAIADMTGAVAEAGLDIGIVDGHDAAFVRAVSEGADIRPFLARDYPQLGDPALILSTSGTTGEAKGVVVSQTYASGGLIAAHKWGCFKTPPKVYVALSWGYAAAIFQVSIAFGLGGSLVIPKRFSASGMWDDFHAHGCDHVHLMGTMPRMLFNQPRRAQDNTRKRALVTSAAMPGELWRAFEDRFNVLVFECYSAVDAGGCWMTNAGEAPPGSVGRPWIELEAAIVDDDDRALGPEEVGELVMRPKGAAPSVAYYKDPEASAEKVRNGWIHFGDYFRRDADGNYWFVDRKRDLIRRRAMGISPNEVEALMRQAPGVEEVTAFAVPADMGEDEIKIVVVPDRTGASHEAILEYAERKLPAYMVPRYVELADSLPKTLGSERVQRFQLRTRWRNEATWDRETSGFLSEA